LGLAAGLLSVGLGILWHTPVIFTAIALLVAILAVIALGRRMIAFRSDHAGITLGAMPDKLTFRRGQAVFVPWADAEQIILYPACLRGQGSYASVQCIGVQRRDIARPCPRPASRPPAAQYLAWRPGRVAGLLAGGRLDRERLAAVTAAMAPGIPNRRQPRIKDPLLHASPPHVQDTPRHPQGSGADAGGDDTIAVILLSLVAPARANQAAWPAS
jgi:hypothetical protein